MVKILIINTVRFKLNGISSVIMNYYKAMDKTDLSIEMLSVDDLSEEYQALFAANSIKYYIIKRKNPLSYFFNLYKLAKEKRYDIVHVHGNSSTMAVELLACKLAGVNVRIAHSHNTTTAHPIVHKLLYPVFKSSYTHGFACGEDAGKWLFRDNEFVEIKNGIHLQQYVFDENQRDLYRKKLNITDEIIIGHVGNFVEQKNHTFILDMFSELFKDNDKYKLLLISDGYLLEDMKKKAESLGIQENVIFLGKTTEVYNYLMAMDVFILPSLYEGFPVVLVEALASGLECIVSDTIDENCNIVGNMDFLSIDDKLLWVKKLRNISISKSRKSISRENENLLKIKGFDIEQNSKMMKKLYFEYKKLI